MQTTTESELSVVDQHNGTTTEVHSLSKLQERKLVDYLDGQFMEINSNFKKRSEPSMTRLPTLPSYLGAMRQLISFILQIPPTGSSLALRTTFLLRLTGDVMSSVPGYPPNLKDLQELLEFLDDLDQAWLVVLQVQVWDATRREGTDFVVPAEKVIAKQPALPNPTSQTERIRLRSLLITGTASLEEWLTGLDVEEEDYSLALGRTGLQQNFDDLFASTLAELGNVQGALNDPEGMEATC